LDLGVTSNHGTYFFNQLVALQILVGDKASAIDSLNDYFTGQYLHQINAQGGQVRGTYGVSALMLTPDHNSRSK
jgi:hypothetical protein